jgi:hypothetical protein
MAWITPGQAAAPAATEQALQRMHAQFVEAFVDSEGFGVTRSPPMMRLMMKNNGTAVGDTGLCVMSVELIGIAKHDPPVVYPPSPFSGFQHTDRKEDSPSSGETRDLTASEREAVRMLTEGWQLIVKSEGDEVRVTGPIRARSSCLECHKQRKTGDVLGALGYRMGKLIGPAGSQFCGLYADAPQNAPEPLPPEPLP